MATPRPPAAVPHGTGDGPPGFLLLALMMLLAPALGVPGELMLQDTLKSAIVALFTLAAAFLFLLAQGRRDGPLRWHHVLWLPVLLMAYALGSMGWSHAYLAGVEAVRWFVFGVIGWLALNTFTRKGLPLFAGCVHLGAVVASLWAALQFWTDFGLFPQGPVPASTFVNRNFFAEFAVCTLPFGTLLLLRARRPAMIAMLAASLGFVLVAILMTGTRGALLAVGLLLLALPVAAWRCRRGLAFPGWSRRVRAMACVVLAGTVLLLGSIPSGSPRVVEEGHGATPLARGLQRAKAIGPADHSLGVRMVMWRATLHAIADRPLAGMGAGAWENEIPRYQEEGAQLETDYYVHNEFLQLVAEYGIAGWAFLLLLAAYLVRAAWRTWSGQGAEADAERPWRAVFLCSVLALVLVSTIGFPWRLAATGALFAACLGGLAASDARLGWHRLARPLPWSPRVRQVALAASAGCLALAAFITQRAAEAESRLVGAVQMALDITASGQPDDPRFAEAKQAMLQLVRDGIAINPHYRKLTPIVADELARWGDWANATWVWESVLRSRPNVVAILGNAARGHGAMGHRKESLAYLERAQALQPRAAPVRALEVLLLARQGDEAAAMQRARQAMAEGIADQELVDTYFILAWRARDHALAERLLRERMRRWPETHAHGLVQLGILDEERRKAP